MANMEDYQLAPVDVEMGNNESPVVHPAPPILQQQAWLGNLDLFRAELQRRNHPLDFKAGPDVHPNRTPLHLAAMQGHDEVVEFILRDPNISREVVNAKDCFGYTPLHLAVRHLHESVVRLLVTSLWVLPDRFLAATGEPDGLDENHGGHTPLHLAAVRGNTTIAKILLRQPCQLEFAYDPVNIRATTWHGDTPLDIARRKEFEELVELLEGSDLYWLQQERERHATSANAILEGAALVAAAAFGSWVQPPAGISALDSAVEYGAPSPRAASSSSSPSLDRNGNSRFYAFDALAFANSVVALVIGTSATFPYTTASLEVEVQHIVSLIYCFSYVGKLVRRKIRRNAAQNIIGKLFIVVYLVTYLLPTTTHLSIA